VLLRDASTSTTQEDPGFDRSMLIESIQSALRSPAYGHEILLVLDQVLAANIERDTQLGPNTVFRDKFPSSNTPTSPPPDRDNHIDSGRAMAPSMSQIRPKSD
jgi:hypothetical protein